MSDETTALVARLRELAEGDDPADVEALVGRIENLHPAKRILLALRGHRIGRDESVVALLDAIDSVAACTFASWSLEDVLLDLDEWSAFQAESFGLDRDLFHSDPLGLAQFHDRLECLLRDRRIWRCGWDPAAHVALVYLEAGTFVVRMDPSTQRWQGAPASLHDILRLAQLADTA